MAKSKKFVALFRTQWTSAKSAATPAALKRVDFSKGLGPMLDQLEKKWDAAADLDTVPAKQLTELEGLVTKFQVVVKNYQQQIIKANNDDPGNGPSWMALHGALYKIDQGLVQDMKDLGVKCAWVKGWASNSDFDRMANVQQPPARDAKAADEDSADYRKRGFAALLDKVDRAPKGDALAFAKALDTGLATCLPHARDLVKKLRGFSAALVQTVQGFEAEMKVAKPDPNKAKALVKQSSDIVKNLVTAMPPEGKAVGNATVNALIGMSNRLRAVAGVG